MLTANYLAWRYNFRVEFKYEDSDPLKGLGVGYDIQPLDAPESIAAGSHERVRAYSGDYEYTLPTANLRTGEA